MNAQQKLKGMLTRDQISRLLASAISRRMADSEFSWVRPRILLGGQQAMTFARKVRQNGIDAEKFIETVLAERHVPSTKLYPITFSSILEDLDLTIACLEKESAEKERNVVADKMLRKWIKMHEDLENGIGVSSGNVINMLEYALKRVMK